MLTEEKLAKILQRLVDIKEERKDNQLLLKGYKIHSDRLTELKKMKRDVQDQMDDEKRRIEEEFMVDDDYKSCKEAEIKLKEQYKEKAAELRALAATIKTDQPLTTFKVTVDGMPSQIDIERSIRVHLNGKEVK